LYVTLIKFLYYFFIFTLDIPLPVLEPELCNCCQTIGSLRNVPGDTRTTVVSTLGNPCHNFHLIPFLKITLLAMFLIGRFDVHSCAFRCTICTAYREATTEEYIISGYWPGSFNSNNYFFDETLLLLWFHVRHELPGSSEYGWTVAVERVSLHHQRVRN